MFHICFIIFTSRCHLFLLIYFPHFLTFQPLCKQILESANLKNTKIVVTSLVIVPDEIDAIVNQIKKWTDLQDAFAHLIITSGGTGFSVCRYRTLSFIPHLISIDRTCLSFYSIFSFLFFFDLHSLVIRHLKQ